MQKKLLLSLSLALLLSLPTLADGNVINSWETEKGNCGHKACKGETVDTPTVPDTTPTTPTTPSVPSTNLFPAQYNHQPIIDSILDNTNSINDLINRVDRNEDNIYANSYGVHQNAVDIKDLQNNTNAINNRVINNSNRIDVNSEKIINNSNAIKENANRIENNSNRIDNNSTAINKLNGQVGANTQNIENIQNRLDNTNSRINKLDDKLESGLATVTALTALHPNPRAQGRTQVAVGTGMYRDNVAGAVGIFHYINDNTMLSAGASYGGNHEFAGNVGITFNLGKKKNK